MTTPTNLTERLADAIKIVEVSRETHVHWAERLEANDPGEREYLESASEHIGGVKVHREFIAGYDLVLGVLRQDLITKQEAAEQVAVIIEAYCSITCPLCAVGQPVELVMSEQASKKLGIETFYVHTGVVLDYDEEKQQLCKASAIRSLYPNLIAILTGIERKAIERVKCTCISDVVRWQFPTPPCPRCKALEALPKIVTAASDMSAEALESGADSEALQLKEDEE